MLVLVERRSQNMSVDPEDDFEESLVLVELSGIIDQDWHSLIGDRCKILGIETEQPILQLGRYIFMGQYDDLVGTAMIFTRDDNTPERSSGTSIQHRLKYMCHTHKKLDMRRAFLVEREDISPGEDAQKDNDSTMSSISSPKGPIQGNSEEVYNTADMVEQPKNDCSCPNDEYALTSQSEWTESSRFDSGGGRENEQNTSQQDSVTMDTDHG